MPHALPSFCRLAAIGVFILVQPALAEPNYDHVDPTPKALAKLQSLTPDAVTKLVVVEDDDLETRAKLSTVNAYRDNGRFTDRVRADNFVRAWIDKKTGAATYQVYQRVNYDGGRRDFQFVNYASPDGPKTAKLDRIAFETLGCQYGACFSSDTVGFTIDEQFLKAIASQYTPGRSQMWRFKFQASSGFDWQDMISPAEIAGLLSAVDAYRAKHKLPNE